jgi:SAM-dependent methyltransferase
VMFFPNKQAGFREALRVLKPNGRFLFSVWGDHSGTLVHEVRLVVGRSLGHDPMSIGAPVYNDLNLVQGDVTAAGFSSVAAVHLVKRSHFDSAEEAAVANCHGGLVRAHIEKHAPDRLAEITDAAAEAIASRFGNGQIETPLPAILFTAAR